MSTRLITESQMYAQTAIGAAGLQACQFLYNMDEQEKAEIQKERQEFEENWQATNAGDCGSCCLGLISAVGAGAATHKNFERKNQNGRLKNNNPQADMICCIVAIFACCVVSCLSGGPCREYCEQDEATKQASKERDVKDWVTNGKKSINDARYKRLIQKIGQIDLQMQYGELDLRERVHIVNARAFFQVEVDRQKQNITVNVKND